VSVQGAASRATAGGRWMRPHISGPHTMIFRITKDLRIRRQPEWPALECCASATALTASAADDNCALSWLPALVNCC
jgi:hypothetical protein